MRVHVEKWSFARPVAELTDDIAQFLGEKLDTPISDKVGEWLDNTSEMMPGRPEAFATRDSRDAALGLHGEFTRFIRTSWPEVVAAGFDLSKIAIGHKLSTPGFNDVAPYVVAAVVRSMSRGDLATIVIARVRYDVTICNDAQIIVGSLVEFGVAGDEREIEATAAWLREEFAEQLAMAATKGTNIYRIRGTNGLG